MADRFWVGGTASWDGTAGTKWATTSGGAGGASVPTSADDVYFDAASGAVTVTTSGINVSCNNLNFTGFSGTIAGTSIFSINGSVTAVAGMSWTSTGTLQFIGSGTQTLTSAGKTLGAITLNAASTTLSLQDALTSSGAITVTTGTFTTNNFNVTASSLQSSNSNTRTINLGSSTVTLSANTAIEFTNGTGLTFNAGTSTIVCTGANTQLNSSTTGATGQVFYNLSLTGTAQTTPQIYGVNTFNNITVTGPASAGVTSLIFSARQTINGTLSTTGTAGNRRVWFRGVTYGIAQTLTINSAPSLTDTDFRDIYVIGTAAPISGTRIGNLRGCRGITFDAPKTVYWNLAGAQNWSANAWATTTTGTPSTDNFPLAQDTATFTNAGSVTGQIAMNSAVPYTGTVDISGRTSAMNLSIQSAQTIYGDWKNGSGLSISGTSTITFSGRNTQTITSAGITFNQNGNLVVDSYGGTVQLDGILNIGSNVLVVNNGTFNTQGVSVIANSLSSSNSSVRTITLGSSTVTLSGTTPINFGTSTNLTLNAGTSSLVCTTSNASQLSGGGQTFYDVSFTGTGSVVTTISQSNTFNSLSITAPASAGVRQISFEANQTITGALTVAGASAVRRVFLSSNTLGTTRTLTVNSLSAQDCDFRDITIAGAAAGSSPTRAGNCGGNTGITFPAAKTVYWNLAGTQSWSATAWAPSSGGTPDINNFPLAQDTAVFDDTGAAGTVTFNANWNVGTLDCSARTSSMTLSAGSANPIFYGNLTAGTGLTFGNTRAVFLSGRGIQTITSNGVSFAGWGFTIDCATGTVQLADALTIASNQTLTLTSGTFDAVTYNVTTGRFQGDANSILRMGSGTWTLSGTSSIWVVSASLVFFKGTANIVLSDTSTAARTFSGAGLSYNKLTIGGATGTSTLTISGNNQFTELASTKTVAHTIDFGTTTQTFGAWTVTGTAGNVVTLTGTGTGHILAGACTSGIDYLAMGSIGFAATSPGEFYAGANSTGTAAAPVYRTAKPADSTRYWVGGTGNWSDTARWSTGSGGAGGASVPRSHDDVVFDSLSNATAYTATVNAVTGGIRTKALTIAGPASGNLTLAGSTAIVGIHGNVTLPATGLTRTYTGALTLSGSGSATITTNGISFAQDTILNGIGSNWTLGSAFTMGSSNSFQLLNGTLNTANYNCSFARFLVSGTPFGTVTLNLGSSTITENTLGFAINGANPNFTLNAGTSTFNNTQTGSGVIQNSSPNTLTFYNYNFTGANPTSITITGTNIFNDLSFAGRTTAGVTPINIGANQTINGTLTLSAGTNATMRTFVRSNTIGETRTLTCAAVASLTDIDFRDITIAGAAAPVSGTRLGDCKGNSGITFPAAKTVYRVGSGTNWNTATSWSNTSGGTGDVIYFPLAQDSAIFESTAPASGASVASNIDYNIGTIDMSARTSNTMTLATGSSTPTIYGNWINGTGTTLSGTGVMTFAGRGSQTITSAGKTFTQPFIVNTPGGEVALQDSFVTSNNVTLTAGTFNATTYNVTLSGLGSSFLGNAATTKTIAVGSGTWTLAGSSVAWNAGTPAATTVTGTGTISLTSASAKSFTGGSISYSGITLDQGGAGTLTINGSNTFANITNSYKATGATNITLGTTTQRVANFTASGEAGRVLTVQGTSASSPATLVFTGSGQATTPTTDYLTITGVRAYSLDTTWYAGANSTNNGSLGWYFEAGGGGPIAVYIIESATGQEAVVVQAILNSLVADSATLSDSVAGGLSFTGSVAEAAAAAESISAIQSFYAAIAEATTSSDVVSAAFTVAGSIAEQLNISEAAAAALVLNSLVAESAVVADEASRAMVFIGSVSELAAAAETVLAVATLIGQLTETATPADAAAVLASTFSASAAETTFAQDLLNAPGSIYSTGVAEAATAMDVMLGAYLWNDIPDTSESYSGIADTPAAWSLISDVSETYTLVGDTATTWSTIADNSETWNPED